MNLVNGLIWGSTSYQVFNKKKIECLVDLKTIFFESLCTLCYTGGGGANSLPLSIKCYRVGEVSRSLQEWSKPPPSFHKVRLVGATRGQKKIGGFLL